MNCEPSEPSYGPPTASFTAPANAVTGVPLRFDGTGSTDPSQDQTSAAYNGANWSIAPGIASYAWDWGDSTPGSTGATPSHSYASAGSYQVSLTVTDDLGFTSTVTKQVSVSPPETPAVTTTPATGISDQTATLNGQVNRSAVRRHH